MTNEQPSQMEVLEQTLRKVARGANNATGTERMRAALALASLSNDVPGGKLASLRQIINGPNG